MGKGVGVGIDVGVRPLIGAEVKSFSTGKNNSVFFCVGFGPPVIHAQFQYLARIKLFFNALSCFR